MSDIAEWGEKSFYCENCDKPFRSPLFDLTKEFERTIFNEAQLAEVEIIGAVSVANFCSHECREEIRDVLLQQENIRATYPDIGAIETCARCGGSVLMTEFHLTYVETKTLHDWEEDSFKVNVADVQVIAVVCRNCQVPPFGGSASV